ncbi:MAG: ATP-binding protein, partial [Bradymonadaceae bacterium]
MIHRELNVLILGEVSEIDSLFDRPMFESELSASGVWVPDSEDFSEALEASENYDLIVVDLAPHGLEVLEQVRDYRPAAPVVAIADPDELELVLKAERQGLENYVLRHDNPEMSVDLLAETIRTELKRFVEPPTMERPSADQMYRYAHYHNILEPFFVVSVRRYLMYVNRAGRELVERVSGDRPVVGDDINRWFLEPTLEECQTALDRAFAGHEVVTRHALGEEADDGKDDGLHEIYYQPVVDPSGRVVATTIAIHEPGRPQLQRARTTQAVTRFAGGVAHQMNNLLNVITANLGLVDEAIDEREDGEIRRRLERVEHGVERAAHLTHQMQAYSRTAVTQRETLALEAIVGEMEEQLRGAVGEQIELEIDLRPETSRIRADREQLEMAIASLVSNAAEASRPGDTIRVRTDRRRFRDWESEAEVGGGLYAVLEVTDEGEGIAEEDRKRIFEPFYTTRRADEHVGLGLAIVRTVVDQAGGGMEIDSIPNDGTTVRAYFPVQQPRTQPGDQQSRTEVPTVLLVEDDPDLR